jgi:hypothetical protein
MIVGHLVRARIWEWPGCLLGLVPFCNPVALALRLAEWTQLEREAVKLSMGQAA